MSEKKFYLIPTLLGNDSAIKELTPFNKSILEVIVTIWVENEKPARAFLKACNLNRPIQDFDIRQIPKNDFNLLDMDEINNCFKSGTSVGFMSDAGLPCIADPGALLVNAALKSGYEIIPLVGASSLMLGLMGSGMNGQQFVFHGYLPVQPKELKKALKGMESEVLKSGYTQLFIETPYRNDKLLDSLIEHLAPQIRLCLASNLLQNDQQIQTRTIAEWSASSLQSAKFQRFSYWADNLQSVYHKQEN